MYKVNNNSSIHQTSTCMPSPARTRKAPAEELMNCGIPNQPEPSCWDCRFFEPPIGVDRDQPPAEECQRGECMRLPPVIDHGNRDADVNYAVFPIVIACDWCGEFQPRAATLPACRSDDANAAFAQPRTTTRRTLPWGPVGAGATVCPNDRPPAAFRYFTAIQTPTRAHGTTALIERVCFLEHVVRLWEK